MSKIKKLFIPAAAIVTMLTMTGCSDSAKDRCVHIQEGLVAASVERNEGIQDFRLIGTEVDKTGFVFDVNFNGVAKLDDGSQAFTSFTYEVPSENFQDLQKRSGVNAVYNVLDNIVDNMEYTVCTVTPVNDIKNINKAFVNNAPTPFADYNIKKGVVYNLSLPQFNDENNEISFDVKTLMDLRKVKLTANWGIGFHLMTGRFILGYGVTIRACEGTFVTNDTYKFAVDEPTYKQMKEDNSLVYTYVADAINEKDDSKISADRNTTNYVTYDAADLLSYFDMNAVAAEYNL